MVGKMQIAGNQDRRSILVVMAPWRSLNKKNQAEFMRLVKPAASPAPCVVVDLSFVQEIDSYGVRSLLAIHKQISEQRGRVKFCGMTKPVRAFLQLVRLHRVCDLYETAEDATRSFQF